MNENEIEIRDLRLKLEIANDMIEAYKRECEALRKAMLKYAHKCGTEKDRVEVKPRKILMPITENPPVEKPLADWLLPYKSWVVIPDAKESKSDEKTPFRTVEIEPKSEEKIKVIQEAIRTLYHANFTQ